jgi:hypothetical protein
LRGILQGLHAPVLKILFGACNFLAGSHTAAVLVLWFALRIFSGAIRRGPEIVNLFLVQPHGDKELARRQR